MKKITFGFSTTEFPLSYLIRKVQKCPASHCYNGYTSSSDEQLIYEASGFNTHLVNKKNFVEHNKIIEEYEIEIEDSHYHNIKRYIEEDIGTGYDWSSLLGFLLKDIVLHITFGLIKIKNPFNTSAKVCSEAAGFIYINFLNGKKDVEYGDMDVNWILNKIREDKRFKRIA